MNDNLVQVELGDNKKSSPVPLDKSIVRMGSRFYYKDSDLVTLVQVTPKKRRYFRKVSPLITEIDGIFYTKSSIRDFGGARLSIYSPDVVRCDDGEYILKVNAVNHGGKWFSSDYKELVVCSVTGQKIHKGDAIEVLTDYKSDAKAYLSKDYEEDVVTFQGNKYIKTRCVEAYNYDTKKFMFVPAAATKQLRSGSLFVGFNTHWSGDFDRVKLLTRYAGCTMTDIREEFEEIVQVTVPHSSTSIDLSNYTRTPVYVKKEEADLFRNSIIYHHDSNRGNLTKESWKEFSKILGINSDFNPEKASKDFRNYGASDVIVRHSNKMLGNTPAPEFCEIPYSVGIEIESSGGAVPNSVCESMGLGKVGDRSIGAFEYITPALSNDEIGKYIDKLDEVMQGVIMLDKRCATHIHVGAMRLPELQSIMQRIDFAQLVLRLGAHLEDEWFSMLPKFRTPDRYHCYSIKGYAKINEKNADAMLGAYMYGGHESTQTAYTRLHNYSLKGGGNAGRWHGGRYKWLNISNLLGNGSNIRTIEFRLFPATYNAMDLKLYTLMSMLFVKFIIEYPEIVRDRLYDVNWAYIFKRLVPDTKLRLRAMRQINQMKEVNSENRI